MQIRCQEGPHDLVVALERRDLCGRERLVRDQAGHLKPKRGQAHAGQVRCIGQAVDGGHMGQRAERVGQVAHRHEPLWRQQGLRGIVQDDQELFVTAKGGPEALIDLRLGALAGEQAVARRIDAEAGDATQRPARQAHQEQEHPPAPAEQHHGKPFHGGFQDAGERGDVRPVRSPRAACREGEARQAW